MSRGDDVAAQGQLGPDFHQRDEDNIDASREPAAAQRHSWEHGPVVTRLLALVNVTLIPYVAWKFPAEARAYARRSFEAVLRGR